MCQARIGIRYPDVKRWVGFELADNSGTGTGSGRCRK